MLSKYCGIFEREYLSPLYFFWRIIFDIYLSTSYFHFVLNFQISFVVLQGNECKLLWQKTFFFSAAPSYSTHNLQFTSVQALTKHSGAEALSAWLRRKMFLWKSTDLRAKWSSYKRLLWLKGFIISVYQIEISERS